MTTVAHDTASASRSRTTAGLAFAIASAASFGLSGPIAGGVIESGWSPSAAVTVRILGAFLVLVVPAAIALRGRWGLVRAEAGRIAVYGSLAMAVPQLCYFYAITHMSVAPAILIEFLAPVAVVGWLWLRHAQRPGRRTVAGAVAALAGLVLVLDVVSGAQISLVGVAWALGAMVGCAAYFVISADERSQLPPIVLAAGGTLVGGLALLVAGLVGVLPLRATTVPVSFALGTVPWWLPLLLLAVVTAGLAYVTGIAAARRLGSRLASFVALNEVLFAVVFALLLLSQLPGPVQLAGGVLVVLGVVLVKLGEPVRTEPEPMPVE
ncbi:EamA family transporter [Georgenia alba]|uniref:DMT family transporter n=1 Tax=Georgenia alba TaxID=2233858 RepID=A0ABW2Q2T8_9MICO